MKELRAFFATLLGLVAVLTGGCMTRDADRTSVAAALAVAAADSGWAAAAAGRDLEASVATLAADGIMFPPGQPPVIGRAAVREYMRQAFAIPGFSASWVTDTVIVATGGDMAYTISRSRYTFPDTAGGIDTLHAKGVAVWTGNGELLPTSGTKRPHCHA